MRCYGGRIHSHNSTLKFIGNHFSSNSVLYNGGGVGTSLYLNGVSNFIANTAARIGTKYLASSFILLSKNSTVTLHNNSATQYGGVVYVEDSHPITFCASNISTWDKCLSHTNRVY